MTKLLSRHDVNCTCKLPLLAMAPRKAIEDQKRSDVCSADGVVHATTKAINDETTSKTTTPEPTESTLPPRSYPEFLRQATERSTYPSSKPQQPTYANFPLRGAPASEPERDTLLEGTIEVLSLPRTMEVENMFTGERTTVPVVYGNLPSHECGTDCVCKNTSDPPPDTASQTNASEPHRLEVKRDPKGKCLLVPGSEHKDRMGNKLGYCDCDSELYEDD